MPIHLLRETSTLHIQLWAKHLPKKIKEKEISEIEQIIDRMAYEVFAEHPT